MIINCTLLHPFKKPFSKLITQKSLNNTNFYGYFITVHFSYLQTIVKFSNLDLYKFQLNRIKNICDISKSVVIFLSKTQII